MILLQENDRPLVLGLCEKMPFRDKAFDFVIASHVLEHTDDPNSFLSELQRVAKAGYIETSDAFFEKIDLIGLLRCVACGGDHFEKKEASIVCLACDRAYPIVKGIPNMIMDDLAGANKTRSGKI